MPVTRRVVRHQLSVPAPGPAWTPASLPDLLAWYKSDAGVTDAGAGAVSVWADQSGNGRDLTASGTARPTTAVDTLAGINVIKFDGSTDSMSAAIPATSAPATLLCVAKNTSGTGAQHEVVIFGSPADGRTFMLTNGNIGMYAGTSIVDSGTAWGTTNAHQVVTVLNGASSFIYVDGGAGTSGSPGAEPASSLSIVVGSYRTGLLEFWQGDIAEVAVMGSAIGSTDRASWNTYCARWGL